jgi:Cu(I)/Ag(I) efflux system periplasmic protein CusF
MIASVRRAVVFPSLVGALLGLAVAASACKKEDAPATGSDSAAAAKSYTTKGVIKSFGAERKTVNIAHEAIPGYMSAMTMTFDATSPAQLEGLAEGDHVDLTFAPAGNKHVLSAIKKAP